MMHDAERCKTHRSAFTDKVIPAQEKGTLVTSCYRIPRDVSLPHHMVQAGRDWRVEYCQHGIESVPRRNGTSRCMVSLTPPRKGLGVGSGRA